MNKISNIKLKTFLFLFTCILVLFIPFCIIYYIKSEMHSADIVIHIETGVILSFQISLILNEYIYKKIFYSLLKGRIIRSRSYKNMHIVYYIYTGLVFFFWILTFYVKTLYIIPLSTLLFIYAIYYLNQYYLISDGYLIIGFHLIPIDEIKWYKRNRKRRLYLTIRYLSNRSCSLMNDKETIKELIKYFEEHKIPEKTP
jgi:hypothetical protein